MRGQRLREIHSLIQLPFYVNYAPFQANLPFVQLGKGLYTRDLLLFPPPHHEIHYTT